MMKFDDISILVIGDVCLDVIEKGVSNRNAPEADVPVILNTEKKYFLGMGGNVALNVKKMGGNVDFLTLWKYDEDGKKIVELLEENNLTNKIEYIVDNNSKDYCSTVKKRLFSNNNQIARIDKEKYLDEAITLKNMENSLKIKMKERKKYDAIIISDYNKGIINRYWYIYKEYLKMLIKEDGEYFVDTKKKNVVDEFEGMHIFPNTKEIEEMMKYNNCKTRNELRLEMDLDFIIETTSADGALIYKSNGNLLQSKALTDNAIDVYGAGDTFIAAFTLYYTKYKNLYDSLEFANYCSSIAVQNEGTYAVSYDEIKDWRK